MHDIICGINSVNEALQNRQCIKLHLLHTDLKQKLKIPKTHAEVAILKKDKMDKIAKTIHHQGVIGFFKKREKSSIHDIKKYDKIVILDQIKDPQNLGAMIRSSACFKIDYIIIPNDNSCNINTPSISKIASGGIEYVKIITVTNIVQTILEIKKKGIWIIGMDENGKITLNDIAKKAPAPFAMVIGAEDIGLRQLVRRHCDILCKIQTSLQYSTINASAALAIVLYEWNNIKYS